MLVNLLVLTSKALAFVLPANVCEANLVFVGTVTNKTGYFLSAPGVEIHQPNGRIATRFTLSVSRLVHDTTGDGADGIVNVSLPGGQVGNQKVRVLEMPVIDVGDRYAFAVRRIPGRQEPLVLGWYYVAPDVQLPPLSELQAEWTGYCNAE